jgi:phytoene dehydrogenase-like protein
VTVQVGGVLAAAADVTWPAGEDLSSWLPLAELDPYYRLAFHDGSHLDVLPGAGRMAAEVSHLSGAREAERYLGFRRQLELLLEAEWAPFVARDLARVRDLVQVKAIVRLARLGALHRMNGLAEHYLTDWRLIRAHTFQALYVGLDPAGAPGIYSIVSAVDTVGGVPLALADVAAKAGADLRFGTPAEHVVARKRPHVHALCGFARHADEIVDDPGNGLRPARRALALTDWGERFFGYLQGGRCDDRSWAPWCTRSARSASTRPASARSSPRWPWISQ